MFNVSKYLLLWMAALFTNSLLPSTANAQTAPTTLTVEQRARYTQEYFQHLDHTLAENKQEDLMIIHVVSLDMPNSSYTIYGYFKPSGSTNPSRMRVYPFNDALLNVNDPNVRTMIRHLMAKYGVIIG